MMSIYLHPHINIVAVHDRNADRMQRFARHHGLQAIKTYRELLSLDEVDIVINLTNPHSHAEVTAAALRAGKHVYSEKPLAMTFEDGRELVELAESKGLYLAGAPCTLLGPTAQTMWQALRTGVAGKVRAVYAELDEGLLHKFSYRKWISPSGNQWPFQDEFEVGCTIEHAGYCITWLLAMFGPARSVTAFSSILVDEKCQEVPADHSAPDFSVACIHFENGVVARLTNSIVAPHDHSFRIFGDNGTLYTQESWSMYAPVFFRKWMTIRRRTFLNPLRQKLRLLGRRLPRPARGGSQEIDFALGINDLIDAISNGRPCRLNAQFALHVTELALAIDAAKENSCTHVMQSTFEPIDPMPWAEV